MPLLTDPKYLCPQQPGSANFGGNTADQARCHMLPPSIAPQQPEVQNVPVKSLGQTKAKLGRPGICIGVVPEPTSQGQAVFGRQVRSTGRLLCSSKARKTRLCRIVLDGCRGLSARPLCQEPAWLFGCREEKSGRREMGEGRKPQNPADEYSCEAVMRCDMRSWHGAPTTWPGPRASVIGEEKAVSKRVTRA
ncbi:hypothetical protein DPEC_G00152220 [Dallia pectoralis]|uniref:Uncharacterized protein n=1 Tax=Dallia pectoralis TaxID=75939 RepID=A0ACC2GK16_DALPE|nr:hypothetical protein DPEC_G00152220 [Dallia pectoralis]